VRLELQAAAVPEIALDPARMRQVLGNLVQNALRHTPPGGSVVVSVGRAGGAIEVAVADSGEGIAEEHLHTSSIPSTARTARVVARPAARASGWRSCGNWWRYRAAGPGSRAPSMLGQP